MSDANDTFPFQLEDIQAWIIRRKDGTTVRYNFVDKADVSRMSTQPPMKGLLQSSFMRKSYSDWCQHTPDVGNPPIFSDGSVNLYIADAPGARKTSSQFDVCIDGGSVLSIPGEHDLPSIYGDPQFARKLDAHIIKPSHKEVLPPFPRIIKLRWNDRCPPPVYPSFWPALNQELHKIAEKEKRSINVLTICQGGHGRSGSALVALMMCMTDYAPLDALTHIRALHCARAIESKDQHTYLNYLAKELGREENALDAENVPSFKARFLQLDSPIAESYKDRVRAGKGAGDRTRDEGYL